MVDVYACAKPKSLVFELFWCVIGFRFSPFQEAHFATPFEATPRPRTTILSNHVKSASAISKGCFSRISFTTSHTNYLSRERISRSKRSNLQKAPRALDFQPRFNFIRKQ